MRMGTRARCAERSGEAVAVAAVEVEAEAEEAAAAVDSHQYSSR